MGMDYYFVSLSFTLMNSCKHTRKGCKKEMNNFESVLLLHVSLVDGSIDD